MLLAVVVRAAGGAHGLGRGSLFSRPSWALVDVPVKTHYYSTQMKTDVLGLLLHDR